jgi:thiamine biosynthesis lipoprotein
VELFEILEIAKEVSATSQGAFDVSFHAVGSLWKFTPGSTPPAKEEVLERLALVDHSKIVLDNNNGTVSLLLPGMALGLGAIAKGYAVDRAVAVMRAHGFGDVIVEGGGDVYLSGSKGETSWHVGIQDPQRKGAIGRLNVRDQAVVTSGNYQRFFEYQGTKYAHILDPSTGYPVPYERSARSVSVIARDTARADAYATALAVMGPERGIKFAATVPSLDAVMIDAAGTVHITPDLESRFERITP